GSDQVPSRAEWTVTTPASTRAMATETIATRRPMIFPDIDDLMARAPFRRDFDPSALLIRIDTWAAGRAARAGPGPGAPEAVPTPSAGVMTAAPGEKGPDPVGLGTRSLRSYDRSTTGSFPSARPIAAEISPALPRIPELGRASDGPGP